MRTSSVAAVMVAVSVLLVAFTAIRAKYGPEPPERMGKTAEYLCTNPACRARLRLELPAEKDRLADRFHCPQCGQMTLAPAERCNSCGALIPQPLLAEMPFATCPVCHKPVYGSLPAKEQVISDQ
jgi:DNA-directed RNA polymerase subunit RPC12/RpoP